MNSHDHNEAPHDSPSQGDHDNVRNPGEAPVVVSTTDPAVKVGMTDSGGHPLGPDQTLVAETSQVNHDLPIHVHLANVAIEDKSKQGEDKQSKPDPSHESQQPAHGGRTWWFGMAITAVLSLACGMGGAWAYNHFEGKDKNKENSKAGDQAGKDKDKNSGDKASKLDDSDQKKSADSQHELDDIKGKMQTMAAQMATLQERFDSFASLRDDRARELGTMQVKMKEIAHSIEEIADIPRRTQPLEERMNRMQLTVDALSVQLAGRETIRPIAEYPPVGDEKRTVMTTAGSSPIMAAPMVPASPNLPDATLTAAISFFKKSQYIQADQIFNDLQTSKAGDARVWYYSALSHGLATGKWDGETKRFVTIGAERERAGSPSTTEIDTTFADLTVEQGKDWLAAYRARLVK